MKEANYKSYQVFKVLWKKGMLTVQLTTNHQKDEFSVTKNWQSQYDRHEWLEKIKTIQHQPQFLEQITANFRTDLGILQWHWPRPEETPERKKKSMRVEDCGFWANCLRLSLQINRLKKNLTCVRLHRSAARQSVYKIRFMTYSCSFGTNQLTSLATLYTTTVRELFLPTLLQRYSPWECTIHV